MNLMVSLRSVPDYARRDVESGLAGLLAPLGGMEAFVRPGQKVLLKPNMLLGKTPDKAVTTHPEVVRAVIREVQRCGGVVSVGDSPGVGNPHQVAARCGILQVVEETGATFAPFRDSVPVHARTGTFHELEIARDITETEVVINLPKLKTHQMMGLTCGVKNLFGAVVGIRKPRLHLQAGTDKAFFALMLLELAEHVRPALTIVDAVTAMEGDGPGSGDPVHIGALLASASPLAVDTVAIELVGLSADTVWTQRMARKKGLLGSRPGEVELAGDPIDNLRPRSFRAAKATDVSFGLPGFVKNPLRSSISARPAPDMTLCRRCGVCVESCPPQAMRIEGDKLQIDYDRCIRCFCCQELCPQGALLTRQGLLLRLSQFLSGKKAGAT
jgi:uncharacterized protein (DUF362 family)/Pyruvate/2-oxoacid:ferredoxin oxidoreductase delta subunit